MKPSHPYKVINGLIAIQDFLYLIWTNLICLIVLVQVLQSLRKVPLFTKRENTGNSSLKFCCISLVLSRKGLNNPNCQKTQLGENLVPLLLLSFISKTLKDDISFIKIMHHVHLKRTKNK